MSHTFRAILRASRRGDSAGAVPELGLARRSPPPRVVEQ
jgi:hypothetical protein